MSENQGQQRATETSDEKQQSPSEKLEDKRPLGSLIPGAENLESTEIKKEIKPNTE